MTMDDPNLTPNSPGIETEQTDTTSMSPSKRTIVLGVVNTSGMKSINLNRKRRWDQPPDESGEAPSAKMVHFNESIESPESFDHALARINEELPDASAQCNINNCNEPDNRQCPASPCEKIKSDDCLMLVDEPPNDVCDRLSWPHENLTSSVTSSEQNECERTLVRPVAVCSDSVSDEKVSSLSELRIGSTDQSDKTDITNSVASEEPVVVSKESEMKPSNVVSHRSDELRRIMFSYNEGMSDSDTNDSTVLSPNFDNSKSEKAEIEPRGIECLSQINPTCENNINSSEDCSPTVENSVRKVESEFPPQSDLLSKNIEDSVTGDPKSSNVITSNEGTYSLVSETIESHLDIPIKNELDLTLSRKVPNCVDNSTADLINEKDVPLSLKPSAEIPSEIELIYSDHKSSEIEIVESTTTKEDNLSENVESNEKSDIVKTPKLNAIHENKCSSLGSVDSLTGPIDYVSGEKEENGCNLADIERNDDPPNESIDNSELSARIVPLNVPELKSEISDNIMAVEGIETAGLKIISYSETLPADEEPPFSPVCHEESKLSNEVSDESQEMKHGLDSKTEVHETVSHLLQGNSLENISSCFDDVNSNKLNLEIEKELPNKVENGNKQLPNEAESENKLMLNDLLCGSKTGEDDQLPNEVENMNKTDIICKTFNDSGSGNDVISNSLKSSNTDKDDFSVTDPVTDAPLHISIAETPEVRQDVGTIKCNDLQSFIGDPGLSVESVAKEVEGRQQMSREEENNRVQSASELPSTDLSESNNPSNIIDPEVMKVIFGSAEQSSKGVSSMENDCSAGASTTDSDLSTNKMFMAAPPTESLDSGVTEVATMDFNDIGSTSVLEQTDFPDTSVKISESNILSDIPDSLQGLDEIEPSAVVPEETIFEESGGNSILVEGSPAVSLPFDVTDADASLDSTSIITSARDLESEETNVDIQEDILAVKTIEGVVTVMQDDGSLVALEKDSEVLEEEIESITTEVLEEEIGAISTGKNSPVTSDVKISELNEPGDVESIDTDVLMPPLEISAVESPPFEEGKSDNLSSNSNLKETLAQANNIDVGDKLILTPATEDTVYEEIFIGPNPESPLIDKKLCINKEFIVSEDANVEIVKPCDAPSDDRELKIDVSSNIVNESSNDNEEGAKVIAEEIESFDVIEEIVTCEPSASDIAEDADVELVNEDDNAQFATEETQESAESTDDLLAVIDNDTSDAHVSDNDNQNNVVIETSVFMNTNVNLYTDTDDKTTIPAKSVEIELNNIREETFSEKMDCDKISVNMNNEAETCPIDEPMEVEETSVQIKGSSKIPCDSSCSAVIKSAVNESEFSRDKSSVNVPLLKTVSDPLPDREKLIEIDSQPLEDSEASKLEPLTLKIYKDNLTIKTDELDSPKKHKSPKLDSDSKILHSPQSKPIESTVSSSPQNKQFEYTLKIAKDANTNIPKATMSPKTMSPSSSWKLERGSLSPSSPGDTGMSLKLKLPKPSPSGYSSDSCLSLSSALKNKQASAWNEDYSNNLEKKEDIVTSLPKPSLEIGSALKLIMEGEKTEVTTGGSSILEQVLSSSSNDGTGMKKRGRPRKPVETETLPINNSPPPGGGESEPALDSPALDTSGEDPSSSRQVRSCRARTQPILVKPRKPRGGGAAGSTRGGGRGGARGVARPIASAEEAEKIQEKLSEKEKAELAKIEARKEKMRLDRIAKNEAKKAKKLAKKLKDEERRKRQAAEKAEKAAAAAPQVFEEETRMSASESRGHTPAPSSRLLPPSEGMEESQSSITMNTPKTGNHKGRMEIPIDPESDEVRVDQLAEYQWQGSELCMIQEQVSNYLGVKSFKRKYPDLKRRLVEAEERTFLEDSGLVPKSMCDLGLTAVSSAEILDIMFQDFPDKYEEFRQYVRDKQAREMSFKQKALASQTQSAKAKGELRELALEAAAMWNSNLNRERREERRCALDLQTFTVHYPKHERDRMVRNPLRPGLYPVAVIPGQFSDYYKTYTPTELMYFPLNTVMYGPLKPNERRDGSDSSSSSSDDSSGPSSSDESEDEDSTSKECKICNGEKKTTTDTVPEILLQCSQCKGLCHPTCQEITPEMLPHIKKYSWHCSNCKQCVQCKNNSKEEKKLFCDLCDRGYHLSCVGLKKSPEGRWHCSVCSYCTVCGSKDPGGPEWFYEYKKTEKGVRLYQRTLCAPCSKNALL